MPLCVFALKNPCSLAFFLLAFFTTTLSLRAETIAVLTPDRSDASIQFAGEISERLSTRLRVLDASLAETAYSSSPPANPFNITSAEAMRVGTVIGCDAFVVVRAGSQRRSSSERPEYYETYAAMWVFGTRTGGMLYWDLPRAEASTQVEAKRSFAAKLGAIASRLETEIRKGIKAELNAAEPPAYMDAADGDKLPDFKPPVPYKRIKPPYTDLASLYDVRATVDAVVFLNEKGEIVRTDVTRSAGYGLDESVLANIRTMNWRPAMSGGKPIATKFLVRYNFKRGE